MRKDFDEFLGYLRYETKKSGGTVSAYSRDLAILSDFIVSSGFVLDVSWSDLPRTFWHSFRGYLEKDRCNGYGSMNRKFSCYRSFFTWLLKKKHISTPEFVLNWEPFDIAPSELVFLNEDEMREFIRASYYMGRKYIRNRVLVSLMLLQGLRISEACSLKLLDYKPDAGYIRVKGKGSKERKVPLFPDVKDYLESYMEKNKFGSYLFPGKAPGTHVSRRTIGDFIDRVAARIGRPDITPHKLRHSFAKALRRHGLDLEFIQEILGHADIKTTLIYARRTQEELFAAMTKAHPLNPAK